VLVGVSPMIIFPSLLLPLPVFAWMIMAVDWFAQLLLKSCWHINNMKACFPNIIAGSLKIQVCESILNLVNKALNRGSWSNIDY
jgi:hypothetical protein